ncbi:Transcriptional regulator, MerR family protein [Minicystis rosea]|nr:Transcriptional regulator, MerR family protein [Minicystis rosea]
MPFAILGQRRWCLRRTGRSCGTFRMDRRDAHVNGAPSDAIVACMKPGRASRTAEIVCMGRAAAHGATTVKRFADPTALALLPDEARARVERFRAGVAPKGLYGRLGHAYLRRQSKVMVARTVAIDDAIREAASPQVAILGAGLDGRAWRMPELRDVVVLEVDHPDSQRDKRARVDKLSPAATDIRFVPVDFARDALDDALAKAGHDPARPTTWVWEGVVMYLTLADIEATLDVIAKRSAAESRLIILYHSPALMLRVVGFVVGRLGEPLRSSFTADAMRALLSKHGFDVVRDEDLHQVGAALSDEVARATKATKHLRLVTAARRAKG